MTSTKFVACVSAFMLANAPAIAQDTAQNDGKIIDQAISALQSGDFANAIAKSDQIIARFEAGKEKSAAYICTSGSTDTLTGLLGAAISPPADAKTDKTIAVSDNICQAYFVKGFAQIDLQQRDAALPNLESALAMDPDNQHFMNEIAEWYKSGRQWQKSLEIFTIASQTTDTAIETMPNKKQARAMLNDMRCRSYRGIAFNHVEMQAWDKARDALKQCLALIPNDPKSKGELEYITANSGK